MIRARRITRAGVYAAIGALWLATLCCRAQDIKTGVTYVCNGERVIVTGCAIDDQSDPARCQVEYPDRPKRVTAGGSFPIYKSTTRGELRKLLPTCTPPSAEEVKQHEDFERSIEEDQQKAVREQQEFREAHQRQNQNTGGTTDPGTLAMRRCAAAGRDPMLCMNEVFSNGLRDMAGGSFNVNGKEVYGKKFSAGLRMTGVYRENQLSLTFNEDHVLVGCGGAVYEAEYSVKRAGSRIVVTTTPDPRRQSMGVKPFTLTMAPGGYLEGAGTLEAIRERSTGPGAQTAQARRQYLTEEQVRNDYSSRLNEVHRDAGGNFYVDVKPGTMHSASLVSCQMRTVQPTGSTGPTYASQSVGLMTGSSTSAMFGGAPTEKRPWPGPGLRMVGSYRGAGGLSLEFHEDSVIVGCKDSFLSSSYAVRQSGDQLVVEIDNRPQRMAMRLGPDGSLAGSGGVRVEGHAFVGDKQADAQRSSGSSYFASAAASCSVGTLIAER